MSELKKLKQKLLASFDVGAKNPQIGMMWDCFGVLAIDHFKIIDVNDNKTVTIIEDGYPRGPRIKDVEWPQYLDKIRGQLPSHCSLKYLGIKPATEETIAHIRNWQEMMDQPRPLDF